MQLPRAAPPAFPLNEWLWRTGQRGGVVGGRVLPAAPQVGGDETVYGQGPGVSPVGAAGA